MRKPYHVLWEILADELREAIRRLYVPGRDQQRLSDQKQVYALIQELQRLYDEPDFPREAFDGRDPRPPIRRQFIQPAPEKPVPKAKPGAKAPSLDVQREIVQGWYDMSWYDRRELGARENYCKRKGIHRSTFNNYENNLKAAGIQIKKGKR